MQETCNSEDMGVQCILVAPCKYNIGFDFKIYKPPSDKTNKMTCAPTEDYQPGLIRVFAVRMKKLWILDYPWSTQRRLRLDWADAQVDLSLQWAHKSFCWICHAAAQLFFKVMSEIILKSPNLWWKKNLWMSLLIRTKSQQDKYPSTRMLWNSTPIYPPDNWSIKLFTLPINRPSCNNTVLNMSKMKLAVSRYLTDLSCSGTSKSGYLFPYKYNKYDNFDNEAEWWLLSVVLKCLFTRIKWMVGW